MDRRTAPRTAVAARVMALATVPVLLVAGCSGSDSGDDGSASEQRPRTTAPPEPEPVRFTTLPEPCSLLDEDTIEEVVPNADPQSGETLSSSDTSTSGACLWSGLDDYDFRSLTVSLRRFESDPAIGSGDERAEEYRTRLVEEITGDDANEDVSEEQLAETGDAATSISYRVTREDDDEEEEYQQQRVVVRTGNVVVTVDYSGAGFEEADTPGARGVREAAETAAREAVSAVDASAEEDGEQGSGNGGGNGGSGGKGGSGDSDDDGDSDDSGDADDGGNGKSRS